MLYIKHYLLILPLFVAIREIWLPGLTYGVYLILSLKSGATEVGQEKTEGGTLSAKDRRGGRLGPWRGWDGWALALFQAIHLFFFLMCYNPCASQSINTSTLLALCTKGILPLEHRARPLCFHFYWCSWFMCVCILLSGWLAEDTPSANTLKFATFWK